MTAHTSEQAPLLHDDASTLGPASTADSVNSNRNNKQHEFARYLSFICSIISSLCAGSVTAYSLYGHIFQERLQYTQLQVNIVIIAAEMAMYLPIPLLGYYCDRFGPAPLSLLAGITFGAGYIAAAIVYRTGASEAGLSAKEREWSFAIMVAAFVGIGMATVSMYLSAVATCAKNFGRGKYRGLALATPIAAFGLSGMWQSQVGSRLLYETKPDGGRGDVDVFKFFIFLAVTLCAAGLLGTVGLKIVDEEELIDNAVEQLEASGLLESSAFFHRDTPEIGFGTFNFVQETVENDSESTRRIAEETKRRQEEDARKKAWLLNEETKTFLTDHTMWWLAGGLFLVTGPGDTFINNLGTIIGTLYPPNLDPSVIPTSAATQVSVVALTSTIARIATGTITDLLAPKFTAPHHRMSIADSLSSLPPRGGFTVSRVVFLLAFALVLSFGQVLLASGLIQNHGERFWIVSALIGSGYGAVFSLTPIIISVIWGVENFATNWGIVAVVPAFGAMVWGIAYSAVYQRAADESSYDGGGEVGGDILCYGKACYAPTFWAMSVGVWIACALFLWAWKGKGGWSQRCIAV